ncbi:S8 family peptidase [Sphingomonas sp. PR090111-T3T-6A]|uniref:S8 family peptidase n=1 Tax=Sphingomonas sp. PR090111-T3T-6A TaxID=685778 RepID=UPI00138B1326|nr:S8 family peptidase [Sphingomonas sp. PR090111-T3T-6A]
MTQALMDVRREQKQNDIPLDQRGVAVAVEARGNQKVHLGDMKLETRGIKLLSVQRAGDNRPDVANIFLNANSAKSLEKALGKYERWVEGDRPQRFWFFESAESFELANVESLWTDPIDALDRQGRQETVWEVWVRQSSRVLFLNIAERLEIQLVGEFTDFVDSSVITVRATRAQLEQLIRLSGAVAELRAASNFVTSYLQYDPQERYGEVNRLAELVTPAPVGAVRTTILDTGVNFANPLLRGSLPPERCRTIEEAWGVSDHDGHGTNMAGVALYGDVAVLADDDQPVQLTTALESVTVAAPAGASPIPGYSAIGSAVRLVADDAVPRVFCLAATAPSDVDNGQQTSTSAAIDKLAWNEGEATRLFCVAAGNVYTSALEPYEVFNYEDRNADHRLQSPGQALNALTVGGATQKLTEGLNLVAPQGDLSPTSRTSQRWSMRYANKPDIVMEGGNHVVQADGDTSAPGRSTMVLTTHREIPRFPLTFTGETSAATARAAGLVSRLSAAYPRLRAETLRGMMVHSAEWTEAMRQRYQDALNSGKQKGESWGSVVDCFGWGVPNEERLFQTAGNALTLIVEDEILPFEHADGKIRLRQMKYFELPWPAEALQLIDQEDVELRCTLSYFVEPDPHAGSRHRIDRYASHRLRFNLKSADDSHDEAQRRINQLAELEEGSLVVGAGAGDKGWHLGKNRRGYGSLHHDIWEGKGHELARRNGLSVYPVKGWWADRKEDRYHQSPTRFSLIMSIRTKRQDIDLVAETAAVIRARNLTANLVENVAVV